MIATLTFEHALRFALGVEGGYVNHPLDRGGQTNYGITQSAYDLYRQRVGLPLQPVKFVAEDEARAIYRVDYWHGARCDLMPAPVAIVHFDAAVNHGVSRAARLLQATAGVEQDGDIGPITLGNVRASAAGDFARRYIDTRRRHYADIVRAVPSQAVFYRGWLNRMDALAKEIAYAPAPQEARAT